VPVHVGKSEPYDLGIYSYIPDKVVQGGQKRLDKWSQAMIEEIRSAKKRTYLD
jgi:hypothetical protein